MPTSVKRGRPPEDRVARRQQIFRAIGPLISAGGVAGLNMELAAQTAGSSVGGLYHYFPSKPALVLYGLAAENLDRVCADLRHRYALLAASDPVALLSTGLTELVSAGQTYLRPSLTAALELAPRTAGPALDDAVRALGSELTGLVAGAYPRLTPGAVQRIEVAVRPAWADGLADEDVTPRELRARLRGIIMAGVTTPREVVRRPDQGLTSRIPAPIGAPAFSSASVT